MREDRKSFARIMWETWSPAGWFEDATFDQLATSIDSPDRVDVTLHSYSSRWSEAEPDLARKWPNGEVKATKTLTHPTIYFQGGLDGVNPPEVSANVAEKFTGALERVVPTRVDHFSTHEAPADLILQLHINVGSAVSMGLGG